MVQHGDVFVPQSDASVADGAADGRRIVGAVHPVARLVEADPGGADGIVGAGGQNEFGCGRRRRALLDGDGLVQMFRFGDSGVDYRARFVRTEKFVAEERAGAIVYGTFSTQAPGGLFANVLPNRKILSQAGITAVPWRGRVYAFDETGLPWELDEETLETIGETSFGLPRDQTLYAAHSKKDVETGEWLHFGLEYGRTASVHLTTFAPDGSLAGHDVHPLPRFSYLHDWFVTKRFVVLHLHPATIEVWGLLLGLRSIVDSLRWNGADGSLLMILPRDRPAGGVAPRFVETEASFMWHSFNGHEEGDDLVLDFIGYENPDHFIGPDPRALAVMQGRPGEFEHPGFVRRIRVEPGGKRARNEVVAAGNFEWPRIDDRLLGRRNRWGFMASAQPKEFFWDAVARVDFENGGVETYGFGDRVFTSEPVFVPDPTREGASREEAGWLLVVWSMFFIARSAVLGRSGPAFLLLMLLAGIVLVAAFMKTPAELKGGWIDHAMLPLTMVGNFVDILSYIRLFAVGYASVAVLAAFNGMAASIGFDSVLTAVAASILLLFANALNIVLAGLGVLVHAVRLNTLEFSTHKGLAWQGHTLYTPFARRREAA